MLQDVLAILAASVLAVAVFRRLRLPPVISYIAVGVVLGPHVLGVLQDSETTHFLAEFGVVFLLFTVGLEFSLPYLLAMKGLVFGLGGSQVLVTLAVAGTAAWAAGLPPVAAFIAGAVFAVSSTAIVIKQLTEEVELNALHGRIAVGVLLFQDLAVIPFLVVITTVGAPEERSVAAALVWALIKGVAAFAALLAVGRWILRPLFHEVAAAHSAEIFTLTVLLV
ncbi:MAG TPA: cation:proton antiporter, partial [Gammaproteobacteria bacterium]|nr:cation:proton antiporter [Gammaproteobacteria bacterium]